MFYKHENIVNIFYLMLKKATIMKPYIVFQNEITNN